MKYITRPNPDKKTWSVVSTVKGVEIVAYGAHKSFENAAKHAVTCNAFFGGNNEITSTS